MKIAVVGAGAGGSKLIELFNEIPEIEVVSVIDKNLQTPGIEIARRLGIHCSTNIADIDQRADMIVEATGSHRVYEMIKETFGDNKRIVDSDAAQLMMFIVDRQIEIRNRLNFQLEEINKSSSKLHLEMNKIVDITGNLNKINFDLAASAEQSNKFIEQTDEMTRAVNKITQQIKILGLNANIEAARAGEHGRGFSVVATEVQKMSDSTSDFATQISELLKSLKFENGRISSEITKLNDISEDQKIITNKAKNIVDELKNI
ncbi:methyl-accepting chemotaxis protein [Fusibacter bizertensis]|uniref:Methyl-accepting chemotaxis protein n=1 Tax=Fusibacter bizertensis TaxID=1488331 RepID=A0ABT6NG67_9FIRM|nr:methyl-accepting chemotaxis protein [Fusibacter bizertensis]MDH8679428.1 methyl-accepting chemotaxis protein [Fusibacter bizertensis]